MKKPKQLEFKKVKGWGGKRRNAGRPNKSGTINHMAREQVNFKKPLHITMRLKEGLKSLRTPPLKARFNQAFERAKDLGLNVLHFSVQTNHIHLLVECADNIALSKGMKSLGCSLGKAIRKHCGGQGSVFKGRYHLHVLKTPTQVKNALGYVLLNQSKHRGFIPYKDDYSSAAHFKQWRVLLGENMGPILKNWRHIEKPLPAHLSQPRSWLAKKGWMRS